MLNVTEPLVVAVHENILQLYVVVATVVVVQMVLPVPTLLMGEQGNTGLVAKDDKQKYYFKWGIVHSMMDFIEMA